MRVGRNAEPTSGLRPSATVGPRAHVPRPRLRVVRGRSRQRGISHARVGRGSRSRDRAPRVGVELVLYRATRTTRERARAGAPSAVRIQCRTKEHGRTTRASERPSPRATVVVRVASMHSARSCVSIERRPYGHGPLPRFAPPERQRIMTLLLATLENVKLHRTPKPHPAERLAMFLPMQMVGTLLRWRIILLAYCSFFFRCLISSKV